MDERTRFYDLDGKVTTRRQRARSAHRLDLRLFDSLVTSDAVRRRWCADGSSSTPSMSPSAPAPWRRLTRAQTAGPTVGGLMEARAARNFFAKSARARLRQPSDAGGERDAETGAVADSSDEDEEDGEGDNGDDGGSQQQQQQKQQQQDAEQQRRNALTKDFFKQSSSSKRQSDSDSDSTCSSCLEAVASLRQEKSASPAKPPGGLGRKPALKMAMADFTRKIEDNEGTEISTFSYLQQRDEEKEEKEQQQQQQQQQQEEEQQQQPVEDQLQQLLLQIPVPEGMEDSSQAASEADRAELAKAAKAFHRRKKRRKQLTPIDRLRRAVKTVNLLIKACTTEEEQTRKNQARMMTFSDIASSLAEESKGQELNFQLSHFKARKEMTLCSEAQEILRLHPFLRTSEMLRTAMVSLQTAVEAFAEFPTNMKQSLVKVGWYERFSANRVIIRQDQNALNFYFIISGTTAVSVALKKPSGEAFNKTVAFLRKGESFGELALLYGGKRSATVYCKDEVELLAVSREDFIDIFMNLNTEEEPEHIKFLRGIPQLRGWPVDALPYDNPKICMFAYFRKGIVLCRDSNTADFVYVVMSGHCLVMKDLQPCASTIPKLRSRQRMCESFPVEEKKQEQQYLQFLHKDCQPMRRSQRQWRRQRRVLVARPSGKLYVQLRVLQRRDTFGLEPIAFRVFGGTTGVTLVSMGAECILIHKEFFLKHMTETYCQVLRREIQMFPTKDSLNEKLQAYYNWDAFKETLVDFVMRSKYLN